MSEFKSIFDTIRVKPAAEKKAKPQEKPCHKHGCALAGKYRAPKGRDFENQFYYFCAAHVKEYNATYNYFVGLKDDAIHTFQKDAQHGHRPTWTMGARGVKIDPTIVDPFKLFQDAPKQAQQRNIEQPVDDPRVGVLSRNAFATLGLDTTAKPEEIKMKFKLLAKSLHPDSNNGDRSNEEELTKVMVAYKQLKASGFVK
jgi:DnaJ domain